MVIEAGIRSRSAHAALAFIGVLYVVAAIALFYLHIATTVPAWNMVETIVDLVLAGVVILAGWFVIDSLHALGVLRR